MGAALHQIFFDSASVTASNSYHECGLSSKTLQTDSGLSASTQYWFKVRGIEYDITTGSGTVTFEDAIALMNAVIADAEEFVIFNGDLRCNSTALGVVLTAGTTGADLFGALTGFTSFDAAVDNVMSVTFQVPGRRAEFAQLRILLSVAFTGNIEWLLKKTDVNFNQLFEEAVSGVWDFHNGNIALFCQSGDTITISTSVACAGISYVEVAFLGTGI